MDAGQIVISVAIIFFGSAGLGGMLWFLLTKAIPREIDANRLAIKELTQRFDAALERRDERADELTDLLLKLIGESNRIGSQASDRLTAIEQELIHVREAIEQVGGKLRPRKPPQA